MTSSATAQAGRLGALLALWLASALLPAQAGAETVKIGLGGSTVDVAFYIARDWGYFKDEGIEPELQVFSSGAKEIAPLGTGELDVASGAASAGLFNAIARGIGIRIVADKGHMAAGYQYQALMVRKDLVESGAFKSLKDLAGKRMAFPAPGVTVLSTANEAAIKGGIPFHSIKQVFLGMPEQVAAFRNKAIDVSILPEPICTLIVSAGTGVRFMSSEEFYPGDEITMVFYGEKFATERHAAAVKLMRAYLRAVRTYNDAIKDGRLGGPGAQRIIDDMAKNFNIKPDLVARMYAPAVDPDGAVNLASIAKDLAFFRQEGLVESDVDLEKVVDMSFAKEASASLGPYRAGGR